MKMSHTNAVRTTTNRRRGRGRGQGNQRQRNNNSNRNDYQAAHEHNFRPEHSSENPDNYNREDDWKTSNKRNRQPNRGHRNFKNNDNFNENTFKRSHSSSSAGSSRNNGNNEARNEQCPPNGQQKLFSDPNRLPNLAQSSIFTGQLLERFTSLLPKSTLLSTEALGFEQPTMLSNQHDIPENNDQSFANISNNFSYGFRNTNTTRPNPNVSNKDTGFFRANRPPQIDNRGRQFGNNPHSKAKSSGSYVRQSVDSDGFANNKQTNSNTRNNIHTGSVAEFEKGVNSNNCQKTPNVLDLTHPPGKITPKYSNQDNPDKLYRKHVLQQYGFRVGFEKKNSTNATEGNAGGTQETSSTQSALGVKLFSQSQNVEFNIQYSNKEKSYKSNSNQNSNSQGNNRSEVPKSFSRDFRSNMPSFDLPRQIDNYNQFLNTQPAVSQNGREASPSYEEPKNSQTNLKNASSHHNTGLTDGPVAGRINFNIHRPVSDPNQRVPSQAEALRRIQDEYNIKLIEHTAKEKEKEAKKREQYLARYQHIDPGHRLTEGYLDEAAGYDPGLPLFLESEEDIRERQQEQLWRDAQIFQQREREENERRKEREEKKREEWLKKNRNKIAGYTLGHGDKKQGVAHQTGTVPKKGGGSNQGIGYSPQQPSKNAQGSISSEPLEEGETEEERLLIQEQQLLLEALIYSEQTKKEEDERRRRELESQKKLLDASGHPSSNYSVPPPINARDAVPPQTSHTSAPSDSPQSRAALREQLASRLEAILSRAPLSQPPIPQEPKIPDKSKHTETAKPKIKQPEKKVLDTKQSEISESKKIKQFTNNEFMKTKLQETNRSENATLLGICLQPQNTIVAEIKKYQKELSDDKKPNLLETPNCMKPASCVLRNKNQGAVLVLRPSEEALRNALAGRLEVQDEMDKCGESALHRPNVHPEVEYFNNRYDRQKMADTGRATHAACAPKAATEKESEPPAIDYQAEMRAARLRMQQKYEESLLKKQETSQT